MATDPLLPITPAPLPRHPLRYPDFRGLLLSSLLTGVGFVGETVVLGWLLLDRTDSPLVVGLGIALRALPNLVFGIHAGAIADRIDRRLLLRLTSVFAAFDMVLLGVIVIAVEMPVPFVLGLTFLGGAVRCVSQTARQSYAFDVVGRSQVVGGMALLTLAARGGGIAGSLGAGVVIQQAGAGEAYLALAACHLLAAIAILLAKTSGQAAPVARPPVLEGVKEYFGELRTNRALALLVLLTAAVEVFGFSHQALMPSLARDLLHLGPEGLGLLSAFASCGGLVVVLAVSLRGEIQRKGVMLLVVLSLFGLALIFLGWSRLLAVALLAVATVTGLAAFTDLLTQSLIQSAVANDLRGRAMGSWILAVGLGPVGHLQVGALAAVFGVTAALTTNGLLLLALGLATLLTARRIKQL